jgi:hypothetical protein
MVSLALIISMLGQKLKEIKLKHHWLAEPKGY